MEFKLLKINATINWNELLQGSNKFFIENFKKKYRYLRDVASTVVKPIVVPQDSSLKDISQSLEFKNIEQNSWYLRDKTIIDASELNKKFLNLCLKFEVQYLEEINIEIYVNNKEKLGLSLSIVNGGSILKQKNTTEMTLLDTYVEGGMYIIDTVETLMRASSVIPNIQITGSVLKIFYVSSKPIITGGEVEIIGELKTLDGFDVSKFKFYISGEPEYPTPYVYRINKYVS
ncbi:hypothetical protein TMA_031 [Thermus phage TMA]|uniref:hypothetical protein n=1 Tax=Thermus phage TMA TaxID=699370 RepID=UPI00021AAE31|nr:hypothetical protein TMA_031 [Thermus phage TMA]BAK53719.1 hypothetical protein TMA_031 [Thermus phage TMA]